MAIMFNSFSFLAPKDVLLYGFQICWLWVYLMEVILETRLRTKIYIYFLFSVLYLIDGNTNVDI